MDQCNSLSIDSTSKDVLTDTPTTLSNYVEDDFDKNGFYFPTNSSEDNSSPLFNGSDVSVLTAAHLLVSFVIDSNNDKQTSTRLLVLIKALLPQPNKLSKTWKALINLIGHVSKSIRISHYSFQKKICVSELRIDFEHD